MNIQLFDFSVDLLKALLWQHQNATNLKSIIEQKQQWYEENFSEFWSSWYTNVFDLRTANDFGLAVWSIILNIPLYGDTEVSPADYPAFGFNDYGLNFGNGNFATDAQGAQALTTEQKRLVLRLRYFQMITRCAIPETNRFLAQLFGSGALYCLDGLDMTITYVFTRAPDSLLLYVLQQFDILPRAAGVGVNIVISSQDSFGFAPWGANFDNSNFVSNDNGVSPSLVLDFIQGIYVA